jgi:FkbH-like protein
MSPHSTDELDYRRLVKAARSQNLDPSSASIKIAILADCATQQLAVLIKALLGETGIRAAIYEGAFDSIELESCMGDSALYRFAPEAVIIMNCVQALQALHSRQTGAGAGFVSEQSARILRVWNAIQSHSNAVILQSTFAMAGNCLFGNFERKVSTSLRSTVAALNEIVVQAAREHVNVLIHDVDTVASWVGGRSFFDDRAWDLWKAPCSLEYLPRIAKNITGVLSAIRGRVMKCVITDLDNTLWGGVIGDDGVDGITLSAHDAGVGESFVRLQLFLKQLRNRGILLAVCSKNNEATALLPFLEHPDMVLKRDDISVFVANWEDKASGIRRIRDELHIALDSMVFLDDNPFERNLVRELLPGVIVPELPEDPSNVVAYLSQLNLFETTAFSGEDIQRAEQYQREARRRESAAGSANVVDFMRSLDMQIVISRFDQFHLPRIAQLMQRSNQFNLCTRRLNELECGALVENGLFFPLYAKLEDRFGDHGLIAVVILERSEDSFRIRDWLMSCRVLGRGVEQFIMNHVVAHALRMELREVLGEYIPTPKNGMVRNFFEQFGFVPIPAANNQWKLDVFSYQPRETFIRLKDTAASASTEVF